uniref:Arf-GAP domain-containing protein n=1 Tax=Lepeophtheirus salmonis TaxID=72036 RepID=A0A0K2UZ00_LEPSM
MSSGRSSSTKSEDRNTTRIREIQNGCIDNKRCFDCRQRGPNYVNVTVGSFVCTKCSGMLRGVTPPHRIKSISMSTFTNEDVSLLDSRGNLWCQKVWLATYSGSMAEDFTASGDETLKPHILDKYEKKRYYIDPTTQKDLDLFSSSHLRQSSKTTPSVSSTSTHLIGSRISQKYAGSPSTSKLQQALLNGISSSSLSFNTPTQTTPNITTTPTSRTSEIKVLQNVDPFGSSFISSSKGPTTNNNNINNTSASNFEAFANFETATFEPPPAGPLSSPQLFPSPTIIHNLSQQVVCNTNSNLFDANNNPNTNRFDFHFTARPVLNNTIKNSNTFVSVNNNALAFPPLRSSLLPLLTHDSNAVERRKKSKLHLDSGKRPWVNFQTDLCSPPPLLDRKKYVPISKSKSSSHVPNINKPVATVPCISYDIINNSISNDDDGDNNCMNNKNHNPFTSSSFSSNYSNICSSSISNNDNNCTDLNNNPFIVNKDDDEVFTLGTNFFNSLINAPPSLRVVDDCSVTNITDPLRLFRSTTPEPLVQTASSSSTISNQQNITSNNVTNTNNTGSSLQTFPPPSHNHSSNHNYTASSTSRTSSVVSPTMNSNTSTTSEDRYAALKDLDEIFRSVHVSETNDTSGGATNIFTNSSPAVNGASSIFGSVNNDNTTVSGGTDKIVSSIFETSSSMSKTNNDSWKRLSTNSSDNQGWATFGSTTTPSSSSSSSTNTASNPFNLGPTNFSQLNTSPWPTTGTSPVQSGNALSNLNSSGGVGSTSTNGFSDPFSVTNHSFQNSSEILTNDLFANAPKPNGSKVEVSNLNHIAGTFFNSNVINNTSSSSTTCNPWDSPKAFTDNMKPSFNPKNPFL